MNEKIRMMEAEIRRRGGIVHLDDELPDWMQEMFLREVLDCPECQGDAVPHGSAPKKHRGN